MNHPSVEQQITIVRMLLLKYRPESMLLTVAGIFYYILIDKFWSSTH